jgi:molybdopterin-guanine dinucleotide biosynthesis protein A
MVLGVSSSTIIGAVLAGGQSSRMGRDKSAAVLSGSTLRDRALAVLDRFFSRVVLSVASTDAEAPGRTVVVDRYQGLGPLAAVEAVLTAARGRAVFVLACDLPRVDDEVVQRILSVAAAKAEDDGARAWVGAASGRLQPLCGVYAAACLPLVRRHLERGCLAMRQLLSALDVVEVRLDDLGSDKLLNLNYPADLERARMAADDG